jgi:ATPase subunit of ABC transporter with duplicated ATPase domains
MSLNINLLFLPAIMISTSNLSVQFGKRVLFDEVNTVFKKGNCYGIIGANGSGKSTFLKILSGKINPNSGRVFIEPGKRLSVLEQNHNAYDDFQVLQSTLMGNKELYEIKKEMDDLYSKSDFNDNDGVRVGELQNKFEEMDGWNAESDAASLLSQLGVNENFHHNQMSELDGKTKLRVLIAQSLFGNPDILIMDEPTNELDFETIKWLENFLINYENTVIVVSHDRHFLDTVCTHISDIDFGKITHYTGNYSFWYESSQLALKQRAQQNKKAEEKKKELEEFIARFSANVAKSKQATSRKKMIDKLNIEEIKPSSRRYPGIIFEMDRESGDQILNVNQLIFDEISKPIDFTLNKGNKVVLYSKDSKISSKFYEIINGVDHNYKGDFQWGSTISKSYLPLNNDSYFNKSINLIDWLRQWANNDEEREEVFIRGFLGKMIFSGDEALKSCNVLSGGEKVRCILSKMMMERSNFLMLDEPTNHLDLETIQTLNNSLIKFKGNLILTTHDFEFANSVGNRVIEIGSRGIIDKLMKFEDYLLDNKVKLLREEIY